MAFYTSSESSSSTDSSVTETFTPVLRISTQSLNAKYNPFFTTKKPNYLFPIRSDISQWCEQYENFEFSETETLAVKTMRLKSTQYVFDNREVEFILNVPYHPNLLRVYEMFIDPTLGTVNIVMECMYTSLHSYIDQAKTEVDCFSPEENASYLSLPQIRSILRQLLQAIKHTHEHGYVHRDIKPANILLAPREKYYKGCPGVTPYPDLISFQDDEMVLKLADYGVSKQSTEEYIENPYTVGTIPYMPPEILCHSHTHGTEVDIWSFGCIIYDLVFGERLFKCKDETATVSGMLEVLGSPVQYGRSSTFLGMEEPEPAFGYWKDSKELIIQTGVNPYKFNTKSMSSVDELFYGSPLFEEPDFHLLVKVFNSCLMWDPKRRGTAEELLQMPFFNN
ncbi:hypothetical protein WICPIJ_005439 [Wickerhamomyces pijperi]|uniref:Protein kinase domain-containing protein n=1 Tax=Wickerhamomyces pijperi TaxID=599730 RepID=A0A9P8Q5R3_WICPI|nr:hypothetical protein WICPIJ_005439 [Wickerhamomyces pijperi]